MSEITTPAIRRIGVIGLGTMGAGIAQVFAGAGCEVACFDAQPEAMKSLHERLRQNLRLMVEAGLTRANVIDDTLARVRVVATERDAGTGADFVLEAVREDLAVKRELFSRLEAVVAPQTILASNTSSLKLADMTSHLKHQDRVVVAHWFNPPHIVPVVEVVPGERTSRETMDATVELLRRSGKVPIRLTPQIPGFIVNRVQAAMNREVWSLLDQGIATPQDIDDAIRGSMGFRLAASGPLEISDFAGLDVWEKVYDNLAPLIRSDATIPAVIREKIDAKQYGAKSGRGIYDYPPATLEKTRTTRDARFLALAKLLWSSSPQQ